MGDMVDSGSDKARLSVLEAELAGLRAQVAEQSKLIAAMSATVPAADGAGEVAPADPDGAGGERPAVSRRDLMAGVAGVAVAGAVAMVAGAAPAAANGQGQSLTLGDATNSATSETRVTATVPSSHRVLVVSNLGTGGTVYATGTSGIAVQGSSDSSIGVYGTSTDSRGVQGSDEGSGTGVYGTSGALSTLVGTGGVVGDSRTLPGVNGLSYEGPGIAGWSVDGPAAWLMSSNVQLRLLVHGNRTPPQLDTTKNHFVGEVMLDSAGDFWACVKEGIPGRWRKLAGPASAGVLHVLPVPVLVFDSRTTPNRVTSSSRAIDLKANGSGVPAGATAALVVLTAVKTGGVGDEAGFVSLWANGAANPGTPSVVWQGANQRVSSSVVTAVDSNGICLVAAKAPAAGNSYFCDVYVSVVGYYL